MEILVADDEPAVAIAIKCALTFHGHSVLVVPSGEAALERVRAEPDRFSVVLTDHNMPGIGGTGLVKALRAIAYGGRILVLSAFLSPDVEASYRELGVDQMLAKPFKIATLCLALEPAPSGS